MSCSWNCEQCGGEHEMVILPDTLWLSIAKLRERLCAACIENRLGRKINQFDFPPKPVTIYGGEIISDLRTIPVNEWFFEKHGIKFKEWK